MADDEDLFVDDSRVQRIVKTAGSIIKGDNVDPEIKREIKERLKSVLLLAGAIDSSNKIDLRQIIPDLMEQAFWIGRYAPTGPLVAFMGALRQHEAGKGSGLSRAQKAAAGWHVHAKELALQIRHGDKFMSRDDIAGAVIHSWKRSDVRPVGHRRMLDFLKHLEISGTLTRQTKRKPPRKK